MSTEGPAKPATFSDHSELARELGLFDSIMVVVGLVIGSGIFLTSGTIAQAIPQTEWILLVWVLGGVLSLTGALTFAELGALMPRAGGQYVFLKEAFGDRTAFLFGWSYLLVIQSGSIAAIGAGFAAYFESLVPGLPKEWVAVVVVLALSAINHRGVKYGSIVQNVAAVLKVGAIVAIGVSGIYLAFSHSPKIVGELTTFNAPSSWTGVGIAMVAVLWTFDGWNCITFSAGEIKNPRRNLPLALVLGTLVVTVCYGLMNYAYVALLPMETLKGTERVAEAAVSALFGPSATLLITIVVLVSTFGSINGLLLTGPRVYYAMARDGLFFQALGRVHPETKSPQIAIWVQGIWSAVLALSGKYDELFTMVMFANFALYAVTGAGLFVLRRKYPNVERPYRTTGYPLTPLIYIASTVLIMVNTLIERPSETLRGCLLIALGLPVHAYWARKKKREAQKADAPSEAPKTKAVESRACSVA